MAMESWVAYQQQMCAGEGKTSPWKNDFSPWKVLDFFPNNSVWTMKLLAQINKSLSYWLIIKN